MKVLLVVHGYPPELAGGTERFVHDLASGLARTGDEVLVCAGTLQGGPGAEERTEEYAVDGAAHPVRVLRLPRTDLYYDHWQKSVSPAVHRRVRELCRDERPDVLSLHHWTRLSRDLVLAAAREGVPATVHLHDYWTSCPLSFRVRPQDGAFCEKACSGMACPPCAGSLPPFTPWVKQEALFIGLAERQADLTRELQLARIVTAPSAAHARAAAGFMASAPGPAGGALEPRNLPLPRPFEPRSAPSLAEGPLVLSQWGGLSRLKGTDLLFEAIAKLPDPCAVRLILAGVPERPGFVDELRARFPAVACELHEPFERDALPDHPVARAHAAVFTSRARESYGSVVDEALCLGLPCALASAPALRERFEEGAGVQFFEAGSVEALRDVIGAWTDSPDTLDALRVRVGAAAGALPTRTAVAASFRAILDEARAVGPPDLASLPPDDWYTDRIRGFAIEEWDRALSAATARELGLAAR